MLRKLYDRMLRLAGGPKAEPVLALVSFCEASFFPLPPDMMLGPMAMARPERAWRYALVCTLASVAGGLLGWAIGHFLFDTLGQAILSAFGYGPEKTAALQASYAEVGAMVILVKGLLPIPFKIVTIISGAMAFSLPIFIAACLLTRGARFFAVAWIFKTYGPALGPVIEKRIGMVTAGIGVAVVLGVVLATQMH